mgnify:CR=1 FL=1
MAGRKPRARRTSGFKVMRASAANTIVDGVARCRFSKEQKETIRSLFELGPASTAFERERGWDILHELELIIEQYWSEDARFRVWPSNLGMVAKADELIECANQLKVLLNHHWLRDSIVGLDLAAHADRGRDRDRFEFDTFLGMLDGLIVRAGTIQKHPCGREVRWRMRSNGQDRPSEKFVCELIRFWHLELGKPIDNGSEKSNVKSTLLRFCLLAAEYAGSTKTDRAMRGRISSVLKQMDLNDCNRRRDGLRPTRLWKV